jgi:hypothetical protein
MGLISWIYGTPSAADNAAANAKVLDLQTQLEAKYPANYGGEAGIQAYNAQQAADISKGDASTGAAAPDASIAGEFGAGLAQGATNVLKAPGWLVGIVGDAAGTALWSIVKNIPWWVWLGAAGYVFYSLGGMAFIRRELQKRGFE